MRADPLPLLDRGLWHSARSMVHLCGTMRGTEGKARGGNTSLVPPVTPRPAGGELTTPQMGPP